LVEHNTLTDLDGWGLVVVDMQNDFIAAGGYYARRMELDEQVAQRKLTPDARNHLLGDLHFSNPGEFICRSPSLRPIVDNVCRVIEHARSGRRPIAYLRAVYDRGFNVQPPSLRRDPERSHYPCRPQSWGAAFIEPIAQLVSARPTDSVEEVIEKHTFDGFHRTKLFHFLTDHKVQTALIVGVETQVCVLATAISAAVNQFKTTILEDCVWTAQEELGRGALAIFRDAFGSTTLLRGHLDQIGFAKRLQVTPNA
jgi:nicotinamidase-related amidase